MRLKNRKTGEIADIEINGHRLTIVYEDGRVEQFFFDSLKDLEEWEDYEEPKEYWCIREDGIVDKRPYPIVIECVEQENRDAMREIGNYFETKEEAEKAVEKLKAWKRLKDKGFRFDGIEVFSEGLLEIDGVLPALERADNAERLKIIDDLDLLFCTEENS